MPSRRVCAQGTELQKQEDAAGPRDLLGTCFTPMRRGLEMVTPVTLRGSLAAGRLRAKADTEPGIPLDTLSTDRTLHFSPKSLLWETKSHGSLLEKRLRGKTCPGNAGNDVLVGLRGAGRVDPIHPHSRQMHGSTQPALALLVPPTSALQN